MTGQERGQRYVTSRDMRPSFSPGRTGTSSPFVPLPQKDGGFRVTEEEEAELVVEVVPWGES